MGEINSSSKYVQVGLPNKEEVASLIKTAMGTMRNNEFAELCDVTAVFLHRALTGKYKRPLSEKFLRSVVENSQSKDVTLKELMAANGMALENEREREWIRRSHYRFLWTRGKVRDILLKELTIRGTRMEMLRRMPLFEIEHEKGPLKISADMVVSIVDADYIWNFEFANILASIDQPSNYDIKQKTLNAFRKATKALLANEWNREANSSKTKYSFVFIEEEVYRVFNEMLMPIPIKGWVTTILVDVEKEIVVEEYSLGERKEESIFDKDRIDYDYVEGIDDYE